MRSRLPRRLPAAAARVQRSAAAPPRVRDPAPPPAGLRGDLDAGALLRLQATAGNQAVGELLGRPRLSVQAQAVACPPPPAPAAPASPHADPKFAAVTGKVRQEAGRQREHPPARAKVEEAKDAAAPPTNEAASKAAASQVTDDMARQKPKGFDRAAFVKAVHEAIEKATPKTMEAVDELAKSPDKAAAGREAVRGKAVASKDAAAKDIKDASGAAPDTGRPSVEPAAPMKPETPGPPPADVGAGRAMPGPAPAQQLSLEHTKCETDGQMAEAGVTREQVASSNEPQFHQAMDAKKQADDHAQAAPQQVRQGEQQALGQAQAGAGAAAVGGLLGMHQGRATTAGHVATHKDDAKAKNEIERGKLATALEGIYGATKKEVEEILGGLDKQVSDRFDAGEKAARDAFNNHVKTNKDAYFARRYTPDMFGLALWAKDKLTSPPAEVDGFIDAAKKLYVDRMEVVINDVATLVETELKRATARIQEGRKQIQEKTAAAPKALQQYAKEAAANFEGKFAELDQSVEAKSSSLVEDLAQKYVAAAKEVDDLVTQMHEENKGLLDQAKAAVGGMVETIKKMKTMLAGMAARAGDVVDRIIDKPIDFLHNLIAAVKKGFGQFADNIWTHLKKGLISWLFGEVAKAGIELPTSFDLKGILKFLAQLLGITWDNIRTRAIKILGEKVVGAMEKGAAMVGQGIAIAGQAMQIYNLIKTEGIAGVWHLITDKVAEMKAQVMSQVGEMVVTQVVVAGIKWVFGLLNPASAFVKACMAIYDIVTWIMAHAEEIASLVNAVIDNLAAIVAGNIGAAANMVEQALSRAIPIAIGFLASLLGLGNLSSKIKAIVDRIQEPVGKAMDYVLAKVIKPAIGLAAKGLKYVKGKVKQGVAYVKKTAKAGVAKLKSKLGFGKKKDEKKQESSDEKKRQKAIAATKVALARSLAGAGASGLVFKAKLAWLKMRWAWSTLEVRQSATDIQVVGSRSPEEQLAVGKLSINITPRSIRVIPIGDQESRLIVGDEALREQSKLKEAFDKARGHEPKYRQPKGITPLWFNLELAGKAHNVEAIAPSEGIDPRDVKPGKRMKMADDLTKSNYVTPEAEGMRRTSSGEIDRLSFLEVTMQVHWLADGKFSSGGSRKAVQFVSYLEAIKKRIADLRKSPKQKIVKNVEIHLNYLSINELDKPTQDFIAQQIESSGLPNLKVFWRKV